MAWLPARARIVPPSGGTVQKLDPSGNVLWSTAIPAAEFPYASVFDGGVYVGAVGYQQDTYKLDAAGSVQWVKHSFPSPFTYAHTVSLVDGALMLVSGWDNKLAKVMPDGSVAWNVDRGSEASTSLAAALDTTEIYSGDGYDLLGLSKWATTPTRTLVWHRDPGYYTFAGGYGPQYYVFTGMPAQQPVQQGTVEVWIGLKNSDDVGTAFDVKAELSSYGSSASGTATVSKISSGFNNAKLVDIPIAGYYGVAEDLTLTLSVRVACTSGHSSGTARLWFNDAAANSRVTGTVSTRYLNANFVLGNTTPGPRLTQDAFAKGKCSTAWVPLGTWSTPD